MKRSRALFLDRDGVININHGYVHTRDRFEFIEGIFEICRTARRLGYLLIVATNQSGIGRGYFSEEDFHALTDWMLQEFHLQGAEISKVYFCPYHPEHGIGIYKRDSDCRKPNPGMLLEAKAEFDLNLSASIFLGDQRSDEIAGRRAGVGCVVLYKPGCTGIPSPDTPVIGRLLDLERYLESDRLPEGIQRIAT